MSRANRTLLRVELHHRGEQAHVAIVQPGCRHAVFADNHQQGWPGSMDQLAAYLAVWKRTDNAK